MTKSNSIPDYLRQTALVPWALSSLVTIIAIAVWGNSFDWQFAGLSVYQVFPIFGLLAFSVMWSHYMTGFMRRIFLKDADLKQFFNITGWVVLIAIVVHPGLLAYQRFRDGFGLPPDSELHYVAPSMSWVVLLGIVSLLAFLAFELHRWYDKRPWWKYIAYASDVAMLAIFYHGLTLGTQLHGGWFRILWWFYGSTLLAEIILKHVRPIKQVTDLPKP